MKAPKSPPKFSQMAEMSALKTDPEKFMQLLALVTSMNSQGEYLHWDKLRFKPLPENLPKGATKEDYWLATKFSRNTSRKITNFMPKEKKGTPFSFSRPDCLLAGLRNIDIKAGGTVSTGEDTIGRQDGLRYLTRSIIEEPFSSSVLEGAATTRVRAQAMIEKGAQPLTKDDRMVLNNYKAMMFIKAHITDELTPELILECHRIVTEGTLDRPEMSGEFRDNNEVFVGDDYGEVFHEPPDFKELPRRVQKLCTFANAVEDEDAPYIHPITRAIIVHFILAYDHPFIDGNGRTARALFYWSALRAGYWMMEYVSISSIIKQAPTQYGMAFLHTESDENDMTYFIMHQLGIIKKAIAELEKYLDRQKGKYRAIENLLSVATLNHRQKYLLTEFIRKRLNRMTIGQHERQHSVSYLTARKDLEELERDGWLFKKTYGRKYIYEASVKLNDLQA